MLFRSNPYEPPDMPELFESVFPAGASTDDLPCRILVTFNSVFRGGDEVASLNLTPDAARRIAAALNELANEADKAAEAEDAAEDAAADCVDTVPRI